MKKKLVSNMYVQCALQVRNFDMQGVCASDCCRVHATSVVSLPGGKKMFRCTEHRGVVDFRTGGTAPVSLFLYEKE